MNNITIQMAKLEDAAPIALVHIKCWQETYRGLMPEDYLNNLEKLEGDKRISSWTKILTEQSSNRNTYIAKAQSKIIGFVSIGKCRDKEPITDGEVYAIYLLKAYHGSGIGKKLFEIGFKLLNDMGMQGASLWVAKGNPTEGFYQHLGGLLNGEKIDKCGGAENIPERRYVWKSLKISTSS